MPLTDIDPTTYSVPTDQALLYSQGSGSETVYKYKLSSGSIGDISKGILTALDVKPADLPCLVYSADLLRCLNENFASVGNMTIALAAKASTAYVKQVAATKVSKNDFLSTVATMPTNAEMNAALTLKANAEEVSVSLAAKADAASVYSVEETQGLFESFIGAETVGTFDELNALEPGIRIFVWVSDPTGDASLTGEQKTGPVLYMWKKVDGVAKYVFQATASGGFSSGVSADVMALLGDGFSTTNTVTAQVGNINSSLTSVTSNVNNLTGRLVTVEGSAHRHHADNNYTYVNRPYGCSDSVEAYQLFTQMSMPTGEDDISKFVAKYYYAAMICSGNIYYALSAASNFNGVFYSYSTGTTVELSQATDITICGDVIAAVQAGNLYVRGLKQLTGVQGGGNLLGTSTLTTDATNWTKVGTDVDWKSLDALWCQWLMIKTSGKLYTAGHNVCGLQATAAFDSNNNPIFDSIIPSDTTKVFDGSPYLVASPTEVKLMEGGSLVSKTDWLDAKAGAYYSMARRGQNGKGSLYLWGCNHCGQIGDGVKYVIDMKVCYAWVNGTTTLYTVSATPTAGDALYSDVAVSTVVGTVTSATASSLISNAVTYTRTASSDIYPYKVGQTTPKILSLENGTVYSDWEDYSAGWYHAIALRHDVSGNSEVYVWGSNEYGQLGNGNYCSESLTASDLPQGVNNTVELIAWPHKLTSVEFPYTDAVSVKATHYGTFITRANGDVFFAGCNKRNQLGIGNVSKDTTFIPTFTKLGSLFSSGTVYAETYGAFLIRAVPQLTENADIAVQATLANDFSPEKLSDAMIAAHSHSVAVGIIDDAALMIRQYSADIPATVAYKHKHNNLSSLNKLTVNNGLLYISGELYSAGNGGSSSGTVITVDASNKQLDSLTDVVGLCNTAGGMPFEVMTYYPKSDTVTYVHLTPLGTQFHAYDRFLSVYKKTETTYSEISEFSADIQRCGIYAIMSNATTAVPNRIVKCTKDLIDCVTQVLKSSTATLKLCYVNTSDAGYDAANPIATLTYATLKSYQDSLGNLYWKVGESSEYRSVDSIPSCSTSSRSPEDEKWFTVYNAEHEVVYSGDDFEANTLYFSDGTVVSNTASITFPSSYDSDNNPVYRAIYTTSDASGDPVIGLTALQSGLYKKEGTSYLKIQKYDAPEVFNEDIFEDGTIYINPSKNSYVGLANQQYTFSAVKYIYSTTASSDGTYPLESVILQLDSKISNQDDSGSIDTFEAGSVSNPILAALPSKYRAYASTATGEYNASIGYDSVSAGNSNQVFGDYSLGSGLANIVVGSMSAAFGNNNIVTSDSSFVLGGSNSVNGSGNYAVGTSNFMYGYYSVTVGCRNVTTGVDSIAVGFSNEVFANRAIAVGKRNKIIEKAEDVIVNGSNNEVYAANCYVQGMNGRILRMEGNNPGEDTSVLCTITANDYTAANYDVSGIANKNGMFWTMGDGLTENTGDPLIVLAYTKYVWHRNAAYFNTTATSSARASIDPYLYEPLHQWKFTGMISQRFTISSLKSGSTTEYTSTYREGGRVKSFDAGLEFTSTGAVTLDAYHAQRFKLRGTGASVIPYLCNFKDGDEFSVVVYAGVIVSWTGFTSNSNQTEGSNSFGALIWKEGSAPRAVNTYSLGFQLIRFTVVDTVCIGELVADTVA